MVDGPSSRPTSDDKIDLLDYWWVIWKYRWVIGGLCTVSILAALIFSVVSPKIYEAKATILLPREGGGTVLSVLAATGLSQIGTVPSLAPNRDLFISVIKSRLMAQKVAERFNFKERFRLKTIDEAIESAKDIPQVSQTKEGVIEIKVEDTDPKMAADIANFYTLELDRLVTHFETTAASRQRRFIEEQIERADKDLKTAEEILRQFQEGNRAFLLGDMANSMRLPGTQVPKVGLQLGRLTRDVKVQETVYALLTQQVEQAKIAEARDIPVVQVLDPAVPPIYKSKPKIKLNMTLAGAVSLFVGVFVAFFLEYISRQRALSFVKSS